VTFDFTTGQIISGIG